MTKKKTYLSKFKLCQTAKQKIRELEQEHGIEPTLDEVICLHEMGKLVECPAGAEGRSVRGAPVLVGDVWLHPLTIGASDWWNRASAMFSEHDPLTIYLLAFALHNGRKMDVLNSLCGFSETKKAVKLFRASLGCTLEELTAAIDRVLPDKAGESDEEHAPVDWVEVVGVLCKYFKGTVPEYWLWSNPMDLSLEMLSKSAKIMASDGEEFDSRDPAFQATHNLQMAINEIIRSRKHDVE